MLQSILVIRGVFVAIPFVATRLVSKFGDFVVRRECCYCFLEDDWHVPVLFHKKKALYVSSEFQRYPRGNNITKQQSKKEKEKTDALLESIIKPTTNQTTDRPLLPVLPTQQNVPSTRRLISSTSHKSFVDAAHSMMRSTTVSERIDDDVDSWKWGWKYSSRSTMDRRVVVVLGQDGNVGRKAVTMFVVRAKTNDKRRNALVNMVRSFL